MIPLLLMLSLVQERVATDARCMECHKKETDEWRPSVHARNHTGCISCHGSDDVNPGAEKKKHLRTKAFKSGMDNKSPAVCAGCHGTELKEWEKSSHWEEEPEPKARWKAKKLQGCLSCHDPHGTAEAARRAVFAERCSHCHRENSEQRKKMTAFMDLADPFEADLLRLKRLLEHPLPGVPYDKAENARDAAEVEYRVMRVRQHSTEFKDIEKRIQAARTPLAAAQVQLQDQYAAASRKRRNYLFAFLGLMAVNVFLLRAWCKKKYSGAKS